MEGNRLPGALRIAGVRNAACLRAVVLCAFVFTCAGGLIPSSTHAYTAPAPVVTPAATNFTAITPADRGYKSSANTFYFSGQVAGSVLLAITASDSEGVSYVGFPTGAPTGWTRVGAASDAPNATPTTRTRTYNWAVDPGVNGGTLSIPVRDPGNSGAGCTVSWFIFTYYCETVLPLTLIKDSTDPAIATAVTGIPPTWDDGTVTVPANGVITDTGGSGVRSMELQRSVGTLTGQTCGSWSGIWNVIATVNSPGTLGSVNDTGRVTQTCVRYRVVGYDNVGNDVIGPVSAEARVDTTLPTGAITSHVGGAFVNGTSVVFTGTASDANSGVAQVHLQLNGADITACVVVLGTFACPGLNSTGTPDGTYNIRVRVTDVVGNVFTGPNQTVIVDNNPPTANVSITEMTGTGNQHVVPGAVPIVWFRPDGGPSSSFQVSTTIVDAGSGGANATYPAAFGANWVRSGLSGSGNGPWLATYTWTPTAATVGLRNVALTDGIGNVGSASFDVRADSTPPAVGSIGLGTLPVWDNTTITLNGSGSMTDTGGSGMAQMQVQRETATLANGACTSWTGTWTNVGAAVLAPASLGLINDAGRTDPSCVHYRVVGTDNVGNERISSTTTEVKVDATNPAAAIDPFPTGSISGTSATISGTASDAGAGFGASTSSGGRVVVRWRNASNPAINGTIATLYGPNAGPTWSATWNTTSVADGTYEILIDARDDAGNTATSVDVETVIIDNSPPTIALTSMTPIAPAGCQYWAGLPSSTIFYNTAAAAGCGAGSFSVTVTAADPPGGLAEVTFPSAAYITSGVVPTPEHDPAAPYTATYAYSASASTSTAAQVVAVGNSGRTTDATITAMLDNVAPTGAAVTAPGGATAAGWWSNVVNASVGYTAGVDSATAPFVASGVLNTQIMRRSAPSLGAGCGAWGSWGAVVTNPGASPYSSAVVDNTCYQFGTRTTDRVGNVGEQLDTVKELRVDRTLPTGTVAGLAPHVHGTVVVSGTHSDDWSGVASATLVIDGTPTACVTAPPGNPTASTPWTCNVDTTALADGSRSFAIRVVDRAGNTFNSPVLTTIVDNVLPTASVVLAASVNPTAQFLVPGPVPRMYVNTRTGVDGSLTATTTIVDAGSGPASATYPPLGTGWTTAPGSGVVSAPGPYVATYSWVGGGSTANPALQSVAVADASGNLGSASFEIVSDIAGVTGASIDQPNGVDNTPVINFDEGADAGSGIRGWQLERDVASGDGSGGCLPFGGTWSPVGGADPGSPYTDSNVTANKCYRYRLVVTDNVGNVETLTDGTETVIADPAGIVVTQSGGSTAVTEGGATDTYTVRLRSRPTGSVSITLTTTTGQVTVAPATLNFTPANWSTVQTVTVTAVDDDVDEQPDPHSDTVQHGFGGADPDFAALAPVPVPVTIADDDVAAFVVSPSIASIAVNETGATTDTYTIALGSQPTADVVVTLATADGQTIAAPATLTFTSSTWATPQTVNVTAVDDAVVEAPTHSGVITHAVASGDSIYAALAIANATASITDNDTPGVTVTPVSGLSIAEAGATSTTYTVVLESQPTATVTITPTPDADSTVAPSPLLFDSTNWNTPRTVTITAVDDALVEGPHTTTVANLIASTDPNYAAFPVPSVVANVADDDVPGLEIDPSSGLVVNEGGPSAEANYRIRLETQPLTDVVITLNGGPDLVVAPTTLTFTTANWNTFQTVDLGAVDDDLDEPATEVALITHTVTGDATYAGMTVGDQLVDVIDDDTRGFTLADAGSPGQVSVAEGGASDTFTLRLTSQPTADVVLTWVPGPQLSVAPATVTFTAANWMNAQTVTVSAIDDQVAEVPSVETLVFTVGSGDAGYAGEPSPIIPVDVSDNDVAGVTFTPASGPFSLSETAPSSVTYTVVLDTQPTGPVTVAVAADSQVSASPAALTFTPANWSTPRTVTATAVDDDVVELTPHAGSITHSIGVADPQYTLVSGLPTFAIDITDNDVPSVAVTGAPLVLAEGGATDTYTVVLGRRPRAGETVTVTTAAADGQTTSAPGVLTFDSTNWDTPQTVTVTAVQDLVTEANPHPALITHSVSSTDALWAAASAADVAASITDDDIPGVRFTPTGPLSVSEAGATSATYDVRLETQPTAPVTIDLAANAQVGVAPTSLTFDSTNWMTPRTVTVSAIDDPMVEATPHAGSVAHTISAGDAIYLALAALPPMPVDVADDDTPTVVVDVAGSVDIAEGGATDTYTVVLGAQPRPGQTVTVAVSSDAQSTAAPTSLTFDSSDWNTPKTVTVAAVDDLVSESTHSSVLAHAVTSTDPAWSGVTAASVTATITDNDIAGVTLTPAPPARLAAVEGGTNGTYSIALQTQPMGPVTVTLTGDSQVQISSGGAFTFTPSNWSSPQTVVVTAVDDDVVEASPHTGLITQAVTAGDAAYLALTLPNVDVDITDNDLPTVLVDELGGVDVAEAGETTDTYEIVLGRRPGVGQTVTVTIAPNAQVRVTSPLVLMFDAANWDTPQIVTVQAVDDPVFELPVHPGLITHSVSSSDPLWSGALAVDVAPDITDNDAPGVTISAAAITAAEGGATGTYDVTLESQPVSDVTITVSGAPASQVRFAGASTQSLTFTPLNWNQPQSVVVTAFDDFVAEGPHAATLSHVAASADPAYSGFGPIDDVAVAIADNDSVGIEMLPGGGLVVSEDGATTATYTLRLLSEPVDDVQISFAVGTQLDAISTVTFTATDWMTPQTVTVRGQQDSVAEGTPHPGTITHTVTSVGDHGYDAYPLVAQAVDITDDDVAGFALTGAGSGELAVEEAGATSDTFTIALTSQPTSDVVLTPVLDGQVTATPSPLTFTAANWSTPQVVTVTAVDDDVDEDDPHTGLLGFTTTGNAQYAALAAPSATVDVGDDDTAGVLVDAGPVVVDEDRTITGTYEIVLASEPVGPVEITITPDAQVEVTSPTTLTFTAANWDAPQTVSVRAVDDVVTETTPHTGTIVHAVAPGSADPAYVAVVPDPIDAAIADNDAPGVTVDELGGVAVSENGSITDSYEVELDAQPTASVTVTPVFDPTHVSVTPASLTFTPGTWNVAQSFTVTGVQNDVDQGISYVRTIAHTVATADPAWTGVTTAAPVDVTVTDDDTAGVTVAPIAGLTVDENGPATAAYTVVLDSEPTADVVVTLAADAQVGVSSPTLSFTPATWDTPQTVTVTGIDDLVVEGPHTGTIGHAAASTDTAYQSVSVASNVVNVVDDDVAGFEVDPASGVTATEGGADGTYRIRLLKQPLTDVTIAFAPDAQIQPIAALTFTPANWNTYQDVVAAAVNDAVSEPTPHVGVIAHTVSSTAFGFSSATIADVAVDITDDDVPALELVGAGAGEISVDEDGATSDTFSVRLRTQPLTDVTITFTPDAQVAVGGSPLTLTFTPANWNTVQTVTVTAVDDFVDEADPHPGQIAVAVGGEPAYAALAPAPITADVADDDTAEVVIAPAGPLAVSEDGSVTATYTVALGTQPVQDVDVSVTPDAQVAAAPNSLRFTSATWNTPQTVTVTAVDDAVVELPVHPGRITHDVTTTDPVYGAFVGAVDPMDVAVTDDDIPGVLVDALGGVDVTENGSTDTFEVVLTAQPTSDVVVTLAADPQVSLSATVLTFTAANWDQAQTVTVTAVNDAVDELDPYTATITGAVATADPMWSSITATVPVAAIVHDDDVAGVTVTQNAPYSFAEATAATTSTYSVVLTSEPTGPVTVSLAVPSDVTTGSVTSLVFTPANWNAAQTITFGAVDDRRVEPSPHTRTITHDSTSADPFYDSATRAFTIDSVTMDITDDDVAGLVASKPSVDIAEGGATDTVDFTLQSEPFDIVTVTLVPDAQVSLSATVLTFTPIDWNQPHPVTATAVDDAIDEHPDTHAGSFGFAFASLDATYAAMTTAPIPAAITDNDVAAVQVTPGATPVQVDEAGSVTATYRVRLATEPTAAVSVATGTADGQTTVDTATLTFTPGNWNVEQTVTITGVQDVIDEANPHAAMVTHLVTSTDLHYDAISAPGQLVEVQDDDDASLVITPTTALEVTENGATQTVSVALGTIPTGTVTVTFAPDAQTSVVPAALTFDASNWNTTQDVVISAVDDLVDEADPIVSTIAVTAGSAADANYDALASSLAVDVHDDDTAGIQITETGGSTDIAEGSPGTTDTVEITLRSQPTADVEVTIAASGSDATALPSVLTFTAANWNQPQVVLVSAVADFLVEGLHTELFTTGATSAGDPFYAIATGPTFTASISDDDLANIVVAPTSLAQTEGSTTPVSYTVVLSAQPSADVTVTLVPDGQVAPGAMTLTFTPTDWSVPKSVDVLAVDDDVAEGLHTGTIHHTVTTTDLDFAAATVSDVTVDITDNDAAGVTIAPSTITASEGGPDGTYDVRLTSRPTAPVTIAFTDASGGQLQALAPLTIQPADWSTLHSVTVAAVDDLVVEGVHGATVTHTASSTDPNYTAPLLAAIADVQVDILDNDNPGVVFSPPSGVSGTEGATVQYGVSLATPPTQPVTVTFSAMDADGVPVTASLVFDSATWNIPQSASIELVQDMIAEGPHTTQIAHALTSADTFYDALATPSMTIDVVDDDAAGVVFVPGAPGPLAISENGVTATYEVELTSQPTSPVTIDIAALTGQAGAVPSQLVFTDADWDTAQTVVVTAVDDRVDEASPHLDALAHVVTSPDGFYGALAVADMQLEIGDNDDAGIVLAHSGTDTIVAENGAGDTVEVTLATQPLQDVTVTFSGVQVGTPSPPLVFSSSTWDQPQAIPVAAIDDFIAEGTPHPGSITASSTSSDTPYDGTAPATVLPVDVVDDDLAGVVVTVDPAASVSEAVPTVGATYTVRLRSQPVAPVTVAMTPDPQVTVDPATLSFDASNWDDEQVVTVFAVNDLVSEANPHPGAVQHDTTSADANYVSGALTIDDAVVSVVDDDIAGVRITSVPMHSVGEGGATSTYEIRLETQPTGVVRIAPVGSQLAWSVPDITFDATDWMTPKTVTLIAIDDARDEADPHPGTLVHSVTSADTAYDLMMVTDVQAQIADNDTSDLVATPVAGIALDEATASSGDYVLTLTSEPTDPVTVQLAPDAQQTVGAASVVLDAANWSAGVTVTATAVDDSIAELPVHAGSIAHTMQSADLNFDGETGPTVTTDVTDDDVAGVSVTESGGTTEVNEDGSVTDSYEVVLTSQPTAPVTITIATADGQTSVTPTTLVFDATNWDDPQVVTVAAVDDDRDEATVHSGLITHTATSADAFYDGATGPAVADVAVAISDDDAAGIIITPTGASLHVGEGGATDALLVRLASEPTAPVTIAFAPDAQVSVGVASITIAPADWDTPVSVPIAAVDDAVIETTPHTGTILPSVASADTDYTALPAQPVVTVDIDDDDQAGVRLVPTGSDTSVAEDGATSDTFEVTLTAEPQQPVTVDLAAVQPGQVTLSTSQLTFDASTWDQPQVVTVTAVDDQVDEADPHTVQIAVTTTSADPDFDDLTVLEMDVLVADDDSVGFTLTPDASLSVTEGGASLAISVMLTSQPAGNVTLTFSGDSQVTIDGTSSLVFDAANWSTPQTVSVAAIDDSIAEVSPRAATFRVETASSVDAQYDALADRVVDVEVIDDDAAGVVAAPDAATPLAEADPAGTARTLDLVLTSQPVAPVTLTLANADGQLDLGTPIPVATFDASNWDQVQSVPVRAVDDDVDEAATHIGEIQITASGDPNYAALAPDAVAYDVLDDDTADVLVTGGPHALVEGGTASSSTVQLATRPSAPVAIAFSSPDGQIVAPAPVTIDPADWNQPVAVVLTAEDDAIVESSPHSGALTHAVTSADPNYAALAVVDVTADITDNDSPGYIVDVADGAAVAELGATSDTFTFVLERQPAAPVTVDFAHAGGQLAVAPASHTFDTVNWNQPVTVTVTAIDDGVQEADPHTADVDVSVNASSHPAYAGMVVDPVPVSIADDDAASLVIDPSSGLSASEAGPTAITTEVALGTQPAADVDVTLTPDSQFATAPVTLTFTPGNWDTPQSVTVDVLDDAIIEPSPHTGEIAVALASTDTFYAGLVQSPLDVAITDDDVAGLIVTPATGLTLDEADPGTVQTVQVALATQPSSSVTVIGAAPDGQTTVGGPITFSPASWNTPQDVNITVVDDSVTESTPHPGVVSFQVASTDAAYDQPDMDDATIDIADNDAVQWGITPGNNWPMGADPVRVAENGQTATMTLTLEHAPSRDVTVTPVVSPAAQVVTQPANATFTANGGSNQSVELTFVAIDDAVAELDPMPGTISWSVDTADPVVGTAAAPADIGLEILDDDLAGVVITPNSTIELDERDTTGVPLDVVLTSAPLSTVTIDLTADAQVVASPPTVTFDASNWSDAQSVTLGAVDDGIAEASPHPGSVAVGVTSSDTAYDLLSPDPITAAITDDDVAALLVTPTGPDTTVAEGGATDIVNVTLAAQPTTDVVVDATADTQVNATPASVTLTPGDWDQPHPVTVSAVQDAVVEGDHAGTVIFTPSSSDPAFASVTAQTLAVSVRDDEVAGVRITQSGGSTAVSEADTALTDTVTVELLAAPSGDVTVTADGLGQVNFDQPRLVFTPTTWDQPQTLTLAAVDDPVAEASPHTAATTFTIATPAPQGWDGVTIAPLDVSIIDNDTPGIEFTQTEDSTRVAEAGPTSDTVRFRLRTRPTAPVTITATGNAQVTASAPLVIQPDAWDQQADLTVTAVDDTLVEGPHAGAVTFAVASEDARYASQTIPQLAVEIADNDGPGATTTVTEPPQGTTPPGPTVETDDTEIDTDDTEDGFEEGEEDSDDEAGPREPAGTDGQGTPQAGTGTGAGNVPGDSGEEGRLEEDVERSPRAPRPEEGTGQQLRSGEDAEPSTFERAADWTKDRARHHAPSLMGLLLALAAVWFLVLDPLRRMGAGAAARRRALAKQRGRRARPPRWRRQGDDEDDDVDQI